MALNSEAKRWSMLNLANGGVSHVINPSGSDFDSQVERLTLLRIYGGDLAADVTAPVLSLPTGTKTGQTTATGTVSTDEDNGTLYFWATTSATESAADIKTNGGSQAVSATGEQNVSFTGLTAGTEYFAHYVHDDQASNESNVVNSSGFTTDAAAAVGGVGGGGARHFGANLGYNEPAAKQVREEIKILRKKKKEIKAEAVLPNEAMLLAIEDRIKFLLQLLNERKAGFTGLEDAAVQIQAKRLKRQKRMRRVQTIMRLLN